MKKKVVLSHMPCTFFLQCTTVDKCDLWVAIIKILLERYYVSTRQLNSSNSKPQTASEDTKIKDNCPLASLDL